MKTKTIQRRYNCRAYPTEHQKEVLEKWFGITRYVYNWCIREAQEYYYLHQKAIDDGKMHRLGRYDLCKRLAELKQSNGMGWLYDAPSCVSQEAVRHYDCAVNNLIKRTDGDEGAPKFKSKRGDRRCSLTNIAFRITHPEGTVWSTSETSTVNKVKAIPEIDGDFRKMEMYVSGLSGSTGYDRIKVAWSGPLPAGSKIGEGMTIIRRPAGHYELSIQLSYDIPDRATHTDETTIPRGKIAGLHPGLAVMLTAGVLQTPNPRFLEDSLDKLRRANQSLARKQGPRHPDGPSNRWKEQKLRVAKVHNEVREKRDYYLHLVSRRIIDHLDEQEYQAIAVDNFAIKKMMGDSRFARAFSDAGLHRLKRHLTYKAKEAGMRVLELPQGYPTSMLCSSCGWIYEDLSIGETPWTCEECGIEHDREENASQNVADAGFVMQTVDTCDKATILEAVEQMRRTTS